MLFHRVTAKATARWRGRAAQRPSITPGVTARWQYLVTKGQSNGGANSDNTRADG